MEGRASQRDHSGQSQRKPDAHTEKQAVRAGERGKIAQGKARGKLILSGNCAASRRSAARTHRKCVCSVDITFLLFTSAVSDCVLVRLAAMRSCSVLVHLCGSVVCICLLPDCRLFPKRTITDTTMPMAKSSMSKVIRSLCDVKTASPIMQPF